MRGELLVLGGALALVLAIPSPVLSESREEYLDRLRDVCAVECMQPRELLRTARKRKRSDESDMAGILDIAHVSRFGDKYRLHTEVPGAADFFDLQQLDFGMPEFDGRPLTSSSDIIIEMDKETLFDLLNIPSTNGSASTGNAGAGDDADIVVDADRDRKVTRPTMLALLSLVRDRRVAVRGKPRLVPSQKGARRDFRRKQLTLELGNADDLVLLPRYDENGEPIPEGGVAGVREDPEETEE